MTYPDIVIVVGGGHGLGKKLVQSLDKDFIPTLNIGKSINCFNVSEKLLVSQGMQQNISRLEETRLRVKEWAETKPDKTFGVVLCAATLGKGGGLLRGNLKEWQRVYTTNVLGNLAVLQGLLPHMLQTQFGRIVFLSGGGAANAYSLFSSYSCSKVAIVREAENLAEELSGKGDFSTVALAPGAMKTRMLKKVRDAGAEVKTLVDIKEPIEFIKWFLQTKDKNLNGKFVHSRDDYKNIIPTKNQWQLRRTE